MFFLPFLSAAGNAQRQADCWIWRIRETALWSAMGELWDLFHSLSLFPPYSYLFPLFYSTPPFFASFSIRPSPPSFIFLPPMLLASWPHFGQPCWHPRAPRQEVAVLHNRDQWAHWGRHPRGVSAGEREVGDKDSTWTSRLCTDDMGKKKSLASHGLTQQSLLCLPHWR